MQPTHDAYRLIIYLLVFFLVCVKSTDSPPEPGDGLVPFNPRLLLHTRSPKQIQHTPVMVIGSY